MSRRDPAGPPGGPAAADLDRLVEIERRLEAVVAEAQAEARRIVDAAGEAARDREQLLERECQDALAALRADIERARDRDLAAIAAAARRRAEAFDAVPEARIEQLAAHVIGRLLGAAGEDR